MFQYILRENKSFIPSGQTIIEPGDRIVIICLREIMNRVEQLLTEPPLEESTSVTL